VNRLSHEDTYISPLIKELPSWSKGEGVSLLSRGEEGRGGFARGRELKRTLFIVANVKEGKKSLRFDVGKEREKEQPSNLSSDIS